MLNLLKGKPDRAFRDQGGDSVRQNPDQLWRMLFEPNPKEMQRLE
jgi:hypothetical protein